MTHRFALLLKTAACAAVCLLLFASCARAPQRSLLWYQEAFVTVSLSGGGRSWTVSRCPGGFTAVLTEPSSAAGVSFTVTEGESYAACGSVKLPVSEAMLGGVRGVLRLLSLTEEQLVGVEAGHEGEGENAVLAHYRAEGEDVTIGIGADGLPLYFECGEEEARVRYTVTEIDCGVSEDAPRQ